MIDREGKHLPLQVQASSHSGVLQVISPLLSQPQTRTHAALVHDSSKLAEIVLARSKVMRR